MTGLNNALVGVVEALSGGNVYILLGLTAVLCLILGMGPPTTANYLVAAISRADPIKTGIQGFTYDIRTAILPFIAAGDTVLSWVKWLKGHKKNTGKTYRSYWYEAGHAFANPTQARYDAEDAKLAWRRTLVFI